MRRKLTQKTIDAAVRRCASKPEFIHDTEVPGFFVDVRKVKSGAVHATFFVRYGRRGQRQTVKLGLYGAGFTADDARKAARPVVGDKDKGLDPAGVKKAARKVSTFAEWSVLYLADVKLRKRGWKEDVRHLAKAVAAFGRKPLDKLTPEDIDKVFQTIAAAGHKTDANRFRASVSACLQAAWRRGSVPSNVALRTRPLPEPPARTRILSEAELAAVQTAVMAVDDVHARAALVLLLATGARRSEVLRARWSDVDLEQGLWRIPRAKSGRSEVIPLAAPVVTMLRTLPRPGVLVIPGCVDSEKPRYDLKGPWLEVCEAAKLAEVTGEGKARKVKPLVRLHDLRRSVGAAVARRYGLHVASKLLRHSDIRTTEKHYAPLGIEAIREAATGQSERLATVLPMPAKKAAGEA